LKNYDNVFENPVWMVQLVVMVSVHKNNRAVGTKSSL